MTSHYETLGVHRGSTDAEIKQAYMLLARAIHPDRTNNDPVKSAQMAQVNAARDVLRDAKKRKAYNAELSCFGNACPACEGRGYTVRQRGFSSKEKTGCVGCVGCGAVGYKGR